MSDLYLSESEIIEMTHYHRAAKQMEVLKQLGIPAQRLRDNTVRVMRMHCIHPVTATKTPEPRLKPIRR